MASGETTLSRRELRNYALLLAVVAILIVLLQRSCSKIQTVADLYEVSQDSLQKSKNILGQEFAVIMAFKSSRDKDLLRLKMKDSTIQWLQNTVEDYKGKLSAAIVVSNATTSRGTTPTVITKVDTVYQNGEVQLWPKYSTNWTGRWEEGYIEATKDSIFRVIRVKNEFEITVGEASNGWFRPRQSQVKVLNLNPNTLTQELRAFDVAHQEKRLGIGLHMGYGLTAGTSPQLSPYIGVGLDLRLISIK